MWFLLIFVAAITLFFLAKKKANKKTKFTGKNKSKSNVNQKTQSSLNSDDSHQYHAISICCTEHACVAAVANQKKRYLVAETPQLPLAGCATEHCNCRYEHYDDRRDDDGDRRLSFGLSQDLHGSTAEDRRDKCDRRHPIRV